jgi:hypothetical protein
MREAIRTRRRLQAIRALWEAWTRRNHDGCAKGPIWDYARIIAAGIDRRKSVGRTSTA